MKKIINSNDTKIKFIKVIDKLYEVQNISFYHFVINAKECDRELNDVAESEIFDISYFKDFRLNLSNGWHGKVIDLVERLEKA